MTQAAGLKGKVLIIEDESQIRKFLRISLEAHGFTVCTTRLGEDGLASCAAEKPDLVILDLGLPDIDGLELIPRLREWSTVPIIVLSVRSDETEKVAALDAGANDYIIKPFSISELMARIRVLLRSQRMPLADKAIFQSADLEVDLVNRRVRVRGSEVHLSKKEYDLLRLFTAHAGHVLTHQQILRQIWGPTHTSETHYLRVLVGHLRQKLGDEPSHPRYIITEQGVGYRLVAPSDGRT